MSDQDCLYTVLGRDFKETNTTVVGSIVDYIYAPDDANAVLEQLADFKTKIVSLTIVIS